MLLVLSHGGLPLSLNLHLNRTRQEKLLLAPIAAIALTARGDTIASGCSLVV